MSKNVNKMFSWDIVKAITCVIGLFQWGRKQNEITYTRRIRVRIVGLADYMTKCYESRKRWQEEAVK